MSVRGFISLLFAVCATALSQARTADGNMQRMMPRRACDFVNSIGVNTHFGYYDTQYGLYEEVLRPRLLELGVKHIRDGTFNADVARKYREVGQSGVRLLLITSAERVAEQAEAIGPMLWGVEAVNEPDGRGGDWVGAARQAQQRLYETVRADASMRDVAVVGLSLANIKDSPARLGDISQWMDYGGMHPYAAGQYPARHWGWGMSMDAALTEARRVSGSRPLLVTECGYHNKERNPNHPGVSERAAAIYHLHLFFIYFNQGVERSYKYELLDLRRDDAMTDMECHFGLVRADGSVKPSFTAIRNLLRIVADDAKREYKCRPLAVKVEAPEGVTVRTTLLQTSDGRWFLALMRECEVYDLKRMKDVAVDPVDVVVRTGRRLDVRRYVPNESDTAVSAYGTTDSVTVPLGAEVQILELARRP